MPVTLKIRTGWDRDNRNGVGIARIAEDTGIAAAGVHGRYPRRSVPGEAEYDTIAAIKRAVRIPVLANGDIDSPPKARQVLAQTGCDGLLIGRAARGRPWIFREIAHYGHGAAAGAIAGRRARSAARPSRRAARVLRRSAGRAHRAQAPGLVRAIAPRTRPSAPCGEPRGDGGEQCRLTREYFDRLTEAPPIAA